MQPAAPAERIGDRGQDGAFRDPVHLDGHLGAGRARLARCDLQLRDRAAQRRPVSRAGVRGGVRHLCQHPQPHQQGARLIHAEAERAVHRLGLADHDLPALIREVDRAVRVRRAQFHAPEQVKVVDQFALADTESGGCLGQPD